MSKIKESMAEHPFFKDFKASHLELLAECASHVHFNKGSYLFREGETADWLYLIREGKVVVETQMPGRDPLAIMTIGKEGVVGWSWLFPPYRWHFGARAVEDASAIALNAKCVLAKCREDYEMGYELMWRCAYVMGERLQATRLQLLNAFS
jgi:CRP/FNR family transcriptional regulator, cyclic AMP receptor protein